MLLQLLVGYIPAPLHAAAAATVCYCRCVLQDHLQDHQPERYEDASYTALEISPQLAATQAAKVLEGGRHTSRYQVLHQDAINSSVWDTVDTKPCIVILMEVLDNLPHDK